MRDNPEVMTGGEMALLRLQADSWQLVCAELTSRKSLMIYLVAFYRKHGLPALEAAWAKKRCMSDEMELYGNTIIDVLRHLYGA